VDTECPTVKLPEKWNLKTADWGKFESNLKLPSNFESPDSACEQVTNAITYAVPMSMKRTNGEINPKYAKIWWSEECEEKKKEKNKTHNIYKKNLGNMECWINYRRAETKERYKVLATKKDSWTELVSTMTKDTTTQEVFSKTNAIKGRAPQKTIMLSTPTGKITQPKEVADTLAKYYSQQATEIKDPYFAAHKSARESKILTFPHNSKAAYNKDFTTEEFLQALSKCTKTSAGPDEIPFKILEQIPTKESAHLLTFYNYLWNNGFPNLWKHSILVPIRKHQKAAGNKESYRPIALTNCLCKIMERMINKRLQKFLENNKILQNYQSGFRMAHSTLDPLVRLESDVRSALRNKEHCLAVFLDITKAFDSVWHRGLLEKLKGIGLEGNLPAFIEGFLAHRTFQVRVQNILSSTCGFKCGVPQGAILSPTLFSLVINDMFTNCPPTLSYSLYADDGAFWTRTSDLAGGLRDVQQALDELNLWSHTSGLQFSPSKTKAMLFTYSTKKYPHPPSLNGEPVDFVSSYKFLGMTLDRRLTWNLHIKKLTDRCQADLRLLRVLSHCNWGADYTTLRLLYLAILRPKLEYGDFLLSTAKPTLLKKLDRIQYRAARTILGALRCTPTNSLEAEADLLPLEFLRQQHAAAYGGRALSTEGHPVAEILKNDPYPRQIALPQRPPPSATRIKEELGQMNISINQIPAMSIQDRLEGYNSPCYLNLRISLKKDLTPDQWRRQFKNLISEKYEDRKHIYCDGSLTETAAGSGVWSENLQIMSRLHPSASTLTAELFAIYIALLAIRDKTQRYAIFTDSYNSILVLQRPANTRNYLAFKILKIIKTFPEQAIAIEWVPSHTGIHGNEEADAIAKKALAIKESQTPCLALPDLNRHISRHCHKKWEQQWRNTTSKHVELKPEIGPTKIHQLNKTHASKIYQTQTRHNVANA
jgi:ribonuclease HI